MTNKEKFIEKANEKYNSKYDYSKFIYTNAKTKSIITCPAHGEFEQNPDKHLTSIYGCPECAILGRSQTSKGRTGFKPLKYTWKEIESKLLNKFPNFEFKVDNYTGINSKVTLVCPIHGEHSTSPHTLLSKNVTKGCPKCGIVSATNTKTHTFDEFINYASNLYNGKYTYKCNNYINKKSIITCYCEVHGEFKKSAQKHIAGQGCPKCTIDSLCLEGRLPGGYCETIFNRSDELKNKPAILYYLQIGKYFKIGITINLKQRINALKSRFNSDINIIDTFETTLYNAYLLEQNILLGYKELRTSTKESTELFIEDVLKGKIPK